MAYNSVTNLATCYSEVPKLLYYSHIPSAIIILLLGIFVFFKSKENKLAGRILFCISIVFFTWVTVEGSIWLLYSSVSMMFLWSFLGFLYALMNILGLYFVYAVIDKKDVSNKIKYIFGLLLLPLILLMPTSYNLTGFDGVNCQALEGHYFIAYRYFVGIISILWILTVLFFRYRKAQKESKQQVLLLGFGIISFLLLFSWTEIAGSITQNFVVTQYGLFGMPIFVGFFVYLIVHYHTLRVKLIGAQALVISLIILVGSQFFYATDTTSKALTGVTLALSLGFGYMLIKSVKSEVQRKEELQNMADKLAQANDQLRKLDNAKTEFISIASHQLRTPITAIKGFASLLLEGSYGEVSESVHGALEKVYLSAERLVTLIEDLLNVSRIESGRMQFEFKKDSIEKLVKELYDNFILIAKNKKFYLETKLPEIALPEVNMDYSKVRELLSNFIDNALKYTEKGGATISAKLNDSGVVVDDHGFVIEGQKSPFGKVVRITVSDTGIGIPREEIPYLFKKFSRGKDVARLHVGGTGLGLFVGKAIAESHHGQVWVESDGAGMGSRFIIEIPVEHAA